MTDFAQPIKVNMKYIIPVDEFDLANLMISTRPESVKKKKLLWSCNPKTCQEIEVVIGSNNNQDNLNTGVTNENYEVCSKMKSEKINMNMYLRIVSSLSDSRQSVKALAKQQIEITTVNGKILKVPSDNFLGLSEVRGHIQCRVCRELVTDREAHLMTVKHLNMLATPLMDENCVRLMDAIWSYCVICNTIIGDTSFHVQCNVEHQDLVEQAMQHDRTTVPETTNHTGDYQIFSLKIIPSGSIHKTNENKPFGIDYKTSENQPPSSINKNVNKPTGSAQKSNGNQSGSIYRTYQNKNACNTKTKNDPNNWEDVLENCADKHKLYCKVCNTFVPNSNYNITTHVRGSRHNSNLYVYNKSECKTDKNPTNIELKPSTSKIFYSSLCDTKLHVNDRLSHLQGFYHKEALKIKQIADAKIELLNKESLPKKIDFFYYCQICDRKMQMKDKESHQNGYSHKLLAKRQQRKEKIQATNKNESNLETNKIHQLNIVTNKNHELNIVTNKNNKLKIASNEDIELYTASNKDIGTNKNNDAETQNDLSTKSNIITKPKSIRNIDKIDKKNDIPIHFYCEPCNLEMHVIAKQHHLNSISHYQNVNKNLSVVKNPSETQVHTVKQTNYVKEIPNYKVTSTVTKIANNSHKSIARESANNSQTNIVKETANYCQINTIKGANNNEKEPIKLKNKVNNYQTEKIQSRNIVQEITRDNQTTIVKKEPDNSQTCIIRESANNNLNSIVDCSANINQKKIAKEMTRDNQTTIIKKEPDNIQTCIIKEAANYCQINTIKGANNNEKEPIKLKNKVNNNQTERTQSKNKVNTEQPNIIQTDSLRNGEYANIENNKRFSQDRVETEYRFKSAQNNIICQKRQNGVKKLQCCVIL